MSIKPVAWIDNSGHPHHLRYRQGVREKQLYGNLQPLYNQAAIDAAVEKEKAKWVAKLLAALDDSLQNEGRNEG